MGVMFWPSPMAPASTKLRKCPICGARIKVKDKTRMQATYCSANCRWRAWKMRQDAASRPDEDSPEWTREDIRQAVPAKELLKKIKEEQRG